MKIAIIHDWLVELGGAEKVLESIINVFPDADVFSLVCSLSKKQLKMLGINKQVRTSFIQKLPMGMKNYRIYLPFMPMAIQQLDLSEYDLIISSSYCVAKGVLTGPDQLHICYCHSPVRYAWDLQGQYLKENGMDKGIKSFLARLVLNKIRDFDVRSSFAVDKYIANSTFIQRRILKFYRRESKIIFPPVDTSSFLLCEDKDDYYITCSRLVPYKKIDLIVNAFRNMPEKTLLVIGQGPEYNHLTELLPDNVKLLGYVEYEALITYIQRAKAFVYAAQEDFGIVPVEAQACGTPVIGFGKGGLLDTVIDGVTGVYFTQQTIESIVEAVSRFESSKGMASAAEISWHARQFGSERFEAELSAYIELLVQEHLRTINDFPSNYYMHQKPRV